MNTKNVQKMQSNKNDLSGLVDKIMNSRPETEVAKTLKEIEDNKEYIQNIQLKRLIRLHDQSFKTKCIDSITELHQKYHPVMKRDQNIQNEAALVDRSLRIIEETLELIKNDHNE